MSVCRIRFFGMFFHVFSMFGLSKRHFRFFFVGILEHILDLGTLFLDLHPENHDDPR